MDAQKVLDMLERNSTLIEANSKKLDDIKEVVSQHGEQRTYASAVAGATRSVSHETPTLHSVVISSKRQDDTGEQILERVREAVDARSGWVKVERVRKAKDRKIIMGCRTEEERTKVKKRLQEAGVDLVTEDVTNKDPLLIIRGVLKIHTDEEVLSALRKQNSDVFGEGDRARVKYKRRARNPHCNHVVLSVAPTTWRKALNAGTVRVDLQRLTVEDQTPLVQCTKCLGYGHGRRYCKEPVDLCSHCGGPHLKASCPEAVVGEAPKCRNCWKAKHQSHEHNAFSTDCPIRARWDKLARAAVAYC